MCKLLMKTSCRDGYGAAHDSFRLFHLVLGEFLVILLRILKLRTWCHDFSKFLEKKSLVDEHLEPLLNELGKHILFLSGTLSFNIPPHPWEEPMGRIGRLRRYCRSYVNGGGEHMHSVKRFAVGVHQMQFVLHGLAENLSSLLSLSGKSKSSLEEFLDDVKGVEELVAHVMGLFRPCLKRHCEDEGIVLFLLKNSNEFDVAYGKGFVEELLSEVYSGDFVYLQQLMKERFAKRGFSHIGTSLDGLFADSFLDKNCVGAVV